MTQNWGYTTNLKKYFYHCFRMNIWLIRALKTRMTRKVKICWMTAIFGALGQNWLWMSPVQKKTSSNLKKNYFCNLYWLHLNQEYIYSVHFLSTLDLQNDAKYFNRHNFIGSASFLLRVVKIVGTYLANSRVHLQN